MKGSLSCRFLVFIFCLFFLHPSIKADGRDRLERMIDLPGMKGTVYSLLEKISEKSGFLFVYDSRVVDNDAKVGIKAGKRSVRQAIYEIIGDKKLTLKLVGNHILINSYSHTMTEVSFPQSAHFTINGILLDKQTGKSIDNAAVFVRGTTIGSVTNQEGIFKLHLPDSLKNASIAFTHVGYVEQDLEAALLIGRSNVISLKSKIVPLKEIVVQVIDPRKVLKQLLDRRTDNYSSKPVYLTTFYREGVQLKNKFQNLSEAIFKVYKPSYFSLSTDQVKLLKMSKIENCGKNDTMQVRIRAGIQSCLQLDIMKSPPDFLLPGLKECPYVYSSGGVTYVDGRSVSIIRFEQDKSVNGPLYCGELYIDSENSALLKARFEVQPRYIRQAAKSFVVKQTHGIHLIPQKIVYTVSYAPWKGTYYMHHVRGDLYFKNKPKKLFSASSTIHSWFEMVTCKIDVDQVTSFSRSERISPRTIFTDMNFKYDESFWKDFNIIPLEKEISKIIEKVALKIERIEE